MLDPADCPEDWDPAQGITDTDITFFSSLPKSGPLAGFGLIADGIQSYFDYINEQGGVDGRSLHLENKDDGYAPDKTKTNVDEALGAGSYAGALTILGTPNNLAVWDVLNDECMPQLLNGTGAPQWGDVDNHPWTTGMQLDYVSEAGLWAQWLADRDARRARWPRSTFNNDFGNAYVEGFEAAIEGTDIEVVEQQLPRADGPRPDEPVHDDGRERAPTSCSSRRPARSAPRRWPRSRRTPTWDPIVIMSGTCGSLSQFFQPLVDQGLTGAGTHLIQYVKDVNDAAFADDEFVQLFHETVSGAGPRRHADDVRDGLAVRLVHGAHPARRPRPSRAASTGATSCSPHASSTPRTRSCSTGSSSRRTASRTPTSTRAAGWPIYEVEDPGALGDVRPGGRAARQQRGDRQLRRLPRGCRRLTAPRLFRS